MVSILISLEPFREGKKVTLIEEFDEFNIIQFVISGKVLIGFEMNHKRKYCIKFENKCIIGAYGATFNARASFIYTTYTPITGFFIRKEKWKQAIEDNKEIGLCMKKNIWIEYITRIKTKVNLAKKRAQQELAIRHDQELLNFTRNKEEVVIKNQRNDFCTPTTEKGWESSDSECEQLTKGVQEKLDSMVTQN